MICLTVALTPSCGRRTRNHRQLSFVGSRRNTSVSSRSGSFTPEDEDPILGDIGEGGTLGQVDGERIVIREGLRGYNDTPCGRPNLRVAMGLAALRAYLVVLVTKSWLTKVPTT
jgi:hypothetical protein